MTVLTEGRHPGEAIMSEANFHRSRNNVTVGASQTILANSLVSKKAVVADVVATPSADAGNTASSGTIAMDATAVTTKVKDGRYVGICSAATKVDWVDPDGVPLGVSTHGSLFAKGGIRLTITAGGTPNVVGDTFYVDVAADGVDFQHVAFDPTATDGAEIPVAYSIYPVTTGSGETKKASVIDNDAELNGNDIAWPSGITSAQKANAEQALFTQGIRVRY
jgi:hypothetical protein